MKHFCTLFDRNYLIKGFTLYRSLVRHCPEFTFWILCMDDYVYDFFSRAGYPNIRLIRLAELEDTALLEAKKTRTVAEYCWTLTPSLPLYILRRNPDLESIAYLDADLFFFSDPEPIYEECANCSIAIIEHRFPDYLRHLEINGKYNVQLLIFKNDENGLACLEWWRDRCNEWCYYRLEDGKLGDQKYLDDWTTRFRGVHVMQHIGAGVALWNVMQYRISRRDQGIFVNNVLLIFYHFHAFSMLAPSGYLMGSNPTYPVTREKKNLLYDTYFRESRVSLEIIRKTDPAFGYGVVRQGLVQSSLSRAREFFVNVSAIIRYGRREYSLS